jgi:hypothetical protein
VESGNHFGGNFAANVAFLFNRQGFAGFHTFLDLIRTRDLILQSTELSDGLGAHCGAGEETSN